MKGAGSVVQLYIDLQPDALAPRQGDWVATEAGARYRIETSRLVNTLARRHAQKKRWNLTCTVLERGLEPPDDILVHWLHWYPRTRSDPTASREWPKPDHFINDVRRP